MAEDNGNGRIAKWVALESNPEVMTKYSRALGVPEEAEWVDVLALDDDSLAAVPKPVHAIVFLFPTSESYDAFTKEKDAEIAAKGQVLSKDVLFLKQYINNACGAIGLIHALSNTKEQVKLKDGSPLQKFLEATKDMTPDERGKELAKCEEITKIHESLAAEGQTAAPSLDENVEPHFVALIQRDGHLYELDGCREAPVNHGPSTAETFLKDAAEVCKTRMARDPTDYRFTIVALTSAGETA